MCYFFDLEKKQTVEQAKCSFCYIKKELILKESSYSILFVNPVPLGVFSLLVVPKRHVPSILSLSKLESNDLMNLAISACCTIKENTSLSGLTMLLKEGNVADQTTDHLIVDVIARGYGDNVQNLKRINEKKGITDEQLDNIKNIFKR